LHSVPAPTEGGDIAAKHTYKGFALVALLTVVSLLVIAGPASADTATFSTLIPISINGYSNPSFGATTPYPSTIAVSGMTGTITKVTVGLSGLTKTGSAMKDLDFLLVSPTGDTLLLLSDAGSGDAQIPLTLVFDDAAAGPIPLFASPVVSGTYKPTNYAANEQGITPCDSMLFNEPEPDAFTAPAPVGPYGSTLGVFNGDNPNGTWSLYALLDCLGTAPAALASWSITITTEPTAARMTSFSAASGRHGVTVRWRTGSEVDALGFNVYRGKGNGALHKLNRALIRARGGAAGAGYRFVDRSARAGFRYAYRLQLIDTDGTRSWYGSASVRATRR